MFYLTKYESPLGEITLLSDAAKLLGIWFPTQLPEHRPEPLRLEESPVLGATRDWLERYFAGRQPAISELPLNPVGSEFQQQVWEELCAIPYGTVTTYGAIARKIARLRGKARMSARAIGGAVGKNPLSLIIPCHRVIGAQGKLTGYGGGLELKKQILAHEGIDVANLDKLLREDHS